MAERKSEREAPARARPAKGEKRRDRLARALRDNLKRRKDQARSLERARGGMPQANRGKD